MVRHSALEGLVPESDIQNLTDKVHERGGYAAMPVVDGKDTVYELNIALFPFTPSRTFQQPWRTN